MRHGWKGKARMGELGMARENIMSQGGEQGRALKGRGGRDGD